MPSALPATLRLYRTLSGWAAPLAGAIAARAFATAVAARSTSSLPADPARCCAVTMRSP